MNRVLVDSREMEEIRFGFSLGRGKEGSCYFVEDDNIIVKLYHDYCKNRKFYIPQVPSNQIAFPIDMLVLKNSDLIVGHTMDFLPGEKILNGFKSTLSLSDLKNAYFEIKKVIEMYPNVYMADNCLDNILFDYSKKRINLLDISRWSEEENALSKNIGILNWQLMTALLDGNLNWSSYPLNKEKRLQELYEMHKNGNESLFLEFLDELQMEVSKRNDGVVKTIGNLKLK